MNCLEIIKRDGKLGGRLPLDLPEYTFGNALSEDVQIRIHNPTVSSKHAKLLVDKTRQACIVSLSKTNPTMVNGISLADTPLQLRSGDVISIGNRQFRYMYRPFTPKSEKKSFPKGSQTEMKPRKPFSPVNMNTTPTAPSSAPKAFSHTIASTFSESIASSPYVQPHSKVNPIFTPSTTPTKFTSNDVENVLDSLELPKTPNTEKKKKKRNKRRQARLSQLDPSMDGAQVDLVIELEVEREETQKEQDAAVPQLAVPEVSNHQEVDLETKPITEERSQQPTQAEHETRPVQEGGKQKAIRTFRPNKKFGTKNPNIPKLLNTPSKFATPVVHSSKLSTPLRKDISGNPKNIKYPSTKHNKVNQGLQKEISANPKGIKYPNLSQDHQLATPLKSQISENPKEIRYPSVSEAPALPEAVKSDLHTTSNVRYPTVSAAPSLPVQMKKDIKTTSVRYPSVKNARKLITPVKKGIASSAVRYPSVNKAHTLPTPIKDDIVSTTIHYPSVSEAPSLPTPVKSDIASTNIHYPSVNDAPALSTPIKSDIASTNIHYPSVYEAPTLSTPMKNDIVSTTIHYPSVNEAPSLPTPIKEDISTNPNGVQYPLIEERSLPSPLRRDIESMAIQLNPINPVQANEVSESTQVSITEEEVPSIESEQAPSQESKVIAEQIESIPLVDKVEELVSSSDNTAVISSETTEIFEPVQIVQPDQIEGVKVEELVSSSDNTAVISEEVVTENAAPKKRGRPSRKNVKAPSSPIQETVVHAESVEANLESEVVENKRGRGRRVKKPVSPLPSASSIEVQKVEELVPIPLHLNIEEPLEATSSLPAVNPVDLTTEELSMNGDAVSAPKRGRGRKPTASVQTPIRRSTRINPLESEKIESVQNSNGSGAFTQTVPSPKQNPVVVVEVYDDSIVITPPKTSARRGVANKEETPSHVQEEQPQPRKSTRKSSRLNLEEENDTVANSPPRRATRGRGAHSKQTVEVVQPVHKEEKQEVSQPQSQPQSQSQSQSQVEVATNTTTNTTTAAVTTTPPKRGGRGRYARKEVVQVVEQPAEVVVENKPVEEEPIAKEEKKTETTNTIATTTTTTTNTAITPPKRVGRGRYARKEEVQKEEKEEVQVEEKETETEMAVPIASPPKRTTRGRVASTSTTVTPKRSTRGRPPVQKEEVQVQKEEGEEDVVSDNETVGSDEKVVEESKPTRPRRGARANISEEPVAVRRSTRAPKPINR